MENRKMNAGGYLRLFFTMFKIGVFTFGGGYAMIALLENEFVHKKGWLEEEEFLNMVAISESTPGPIAVNSATYIGYRLGGMTGSLAATLGVVFPSFLIIYMISLFFDRFLTLRFINCAFRGIQVGVVYLLFTVGIRLFRKMKKTTWSVLIFCLVLSTMIGCSVMAVRFSSIFYIVTSGLCGILVNSLREGKEKEQK